MTPALSHMSSALILITTTILQSPFETEYAERQSATGDLSNVICTGTFKTGRFPADDSDYTVELDYRGTVHLLRFRQDGTFSMNHIETVESRLPWKKRVESYSPSWAFELQSPTVEGSYQWKGVFFHTADTEESVRIRFRRRRFCDRFIDASCVSSRNVSEIIASPDFNLLQESEGADPAEYVIEFSGASVDSVFQYYDEKTVRGRLVFDRTKNWSLVGYDIISRYQQSETCNYSRARIEIKDWGSGRFLPSRVLFEGGGVPLATELGKPVWLNGRGFQQVEIDRVEFGQLTEQDFMPSEFGFPDHLVKSENNPERTSLWKSPWAWLVAANLFLFVSWLVIRQRRSRAAV